MQEVEKMKYSEVGFMAGFTLEILAAASMDSEKLSYGAGNSEKLSKIRIESVIEDECFYIDDEDDNMYELYSDKLEMLKTMMQKME